MTGRGPGRTDGGATDLSAPASILGLGACAGLLTGFAELAYLGHRRYVRHLFLFQGADVVWMRPAAEFLLFTACGLCLVAVGRLRRQDVPLGWVVGIYGFLGSLSVLLMFPPLHRSAALVLAAGLGVQAGRLARARADGLARIGRRAWAPLIVVPLLAAAGLHARRLVAERRALAGLPAPAAGSPNVLLVVLDTVRSADLSLYGYPRPTTPRIERWARGGVRFDHTLSTASWTLPSHASMFTGRLPHEQSTDWFRPLDHTWPTLAERLAGRGYATGGFVGNVNYCGREVGLARGFSRYEDYPVTVGQFAKSSVLLEQLGASMQLGRKGAPDVNRGFLRWLDGQRDRPFFAFLNYFDAHTPYRSPEPYSSRFVPPGKRGMPDPELRRARRQDWTREELQPAVDSYDGAISYLDEQIGVLLAELERRRLLANTLVILTSDHGEEFGEHGLVNHGISLYRPSVEVPLIIVFPGVVPAGRVVTSPVSLRDLPATILDLLPAGGSAGFPGRSLARFWRNGKAEMDETVISEITSAPRLPAWYPAAKGPMSSVSAGGLRYIRSGDGREELYDFERDPLEREDLAAKPELAAPLDRLRAAAPRSR